MLIKIRKENLNITYERKKEYWLKDLSNKSNYYKKWIKNIKNSFETFKYKKFKFEGKGYYLYKSVRNTLAPKFGYAHRLYLYFFFSSLIFFSKTRFMVFFKGLSPDLLRAMSLLATIRPHNIFTGRGVRASKGVIKTKRGKVSSYR